jgi:hypothetical protein
MLSCADGSKDDKNATYTVAVNVKTDPSIRFSTVFTNVKYTLLCDKDSFLIGNVDRMKIYDEKIQIVNGIYKVNGINSFLGDIDSQKRLSFQRKDDFDEIIYNTFPKDSCIKWNIKDFGPIYIPRRGDKLLMNRTNYCLYKTLIEWEQKTTANYIDSVFFKQRRILYV